MGMIAKLAWRNIWRHKRRTVITVAAMATGVAICMGTLCFMTGMFGLFFDLAVSKQTGHAQIHAEAYPKTKALFEVIEEGAALESQLRAVPEVKHVVGRVYGFGLLGVGDQASGGQVTGIIPKDESAFRDLEKQAEQGKFLGAEPAKEIVLGFRLAETLKAKVGDEVVCVTSAADGSMGNELYKLVGIVKTGATAVDKTGAFVHRADAQELLSLGDSLHEISILGEGRDYVDALHVAVAAALKDKKGLVHRSWQELNPAMAEMMQLQDVAFWLFGLIIFAVVGLGILNTMLMSVYERTKELGVLIALGLKPRHILGLILTETAYLAFLACLFGMLGGGVMDWYFIEYGIDYGDLDMLGMTIGAVKGVFQWSDVSNTVVLVFIISMVSSLWPALRAARLQPVQAMREQ